MGSLQRSPYPLAGFIWPYTSKWTRGGREGREGKGKEEGTSSFALRRKKENSARMETLDGYSVNQCKVETLLLKKMAEDKILLDTQ